MKLGGNILILTQWSFKDALIQTYTLPYTDIIRSVLPPEYKMVIVTSEQDRVAVNESEKQEINEKWLSRNIELYTLRYRHFGFVKIISFIKQLYQMIRLIRKENISVIHAFCTPAAGIGFLLSKLTGKPLVIDSYEPHAESMVETGTWKKNGLAFRLLFWLEKRQTRHASVLIAATAGMRKYAMEKYGFEPDDSRFFVKPACIDHQVFFPRKKDEHLMNELQLDGKTVCVYAGKFGGTYLKDEVFQLIREASLFWGDSFSWLLLTPHPRSMILELAEKHGIPDQSLHCLYVNHDKIPDYLSLGDFAINPQVSVPSKRYGTPIKNGEYWSMGLPVIISPGISDDSGIIEKNNMGVVADLKDPGNHLKAIHKINELLLNENREQLQQRIFAIAKQYRSFEIARQIYPQIYENQ